MAEALLETRRIEQLERAVVVEPDDLAVIQAPGAPAKSIEVERLFSRFLGVVTAAASLGALAADLAHAENSLALVYADPVPDASGFYRKVGAPGAGHWELTRVFRGEKGATGAPAEIAVSRVALKAIEDKAEGDAYRLMEAGREGMIVWRLGNYAALVAGDPYEHMYFEADDVDAAAGCWVRQLESFTYQASWGGFSEANLATNHLRLRSLDALRMAGSSIELPAGWFEDFGVGTGGDDPIFAMTKPGRIFGQGRATVLKPPPGLSCHIIAVNAEGCFVERIRYKDHIGATGADGAFCVEVSTRYTSVIGIVAGGSVDGSKVRDCIFENCTSGVRVINALRLNGDGSLSAFHPRDVEISGNRFENIHYQAISAWTRNVRIANNWIEVGPDGDPEAPFACGIRCCGLSHSFIGGNTIRMRIGVPAFIFTPSAENMIPANTAAEYNDPRNVLVAPNEIHSPAGGAVGRVYGWSGSVYVCPQLVTGNPDGIAATAAWVFGNGGEDQKRGTFTVDGGEYVGFQHMAVHSAGAHGRIVFKNGQSQSNADTTIPEGGSTRALFDFGYVPIPGYNGAAVEPIPSIEVDNWSHVAPDGFYFTCVRHAAAPAGTYTSARNCRMPYGTAGYVSAAGGAGDTQQSGNVNYPSGHHTRLMAHSSGYSHSPRYMDNGPNGDPTKETYAEALAAGFLAPDPVDED